MNSNLHFKIHDCSFGERRTITLKNTQRSNSIMMILLCKYHYYSSQHPSNTNMNTKLVNGIRSLVVMTVTCVVYP